MEFALNTLVNASSGYSPFELVYGFPAKVQLAPGPVHDDVESFADRRETIRKDAIQATELAQARMAIDFDKNHTPPHFKGQVWLKVVHMGTGYRIPGSSKLSLTKVGPFKVKRRVGQLAYELELPKRYKFHPIISCIHLEQYHPDDFGRQLDQQQRPLVVDGEER